MPLFVPNNSTAVYGEMYSRDRKTHSHTFLIQVCKHSMEWKTVEMVLLSHSHTQYRDQFHSMPQSSSLERSHRGFAASPAWNKELIAAFCFTVQPPARSSSLERLLRLQLSVHVTSDIAHHTHSTSKHRSPRSPLSFQTFSGLNTVRRFKSFDCS